MTSSCRIEMNSHLHISCRHTGLDGSLLTLFVRVQLSYKVNDEGLIVWARGPSRQLQNLLMGLSLVSRD
jgi:hypothetical protein